MTKRAGSTITYASYNLPTVINQRSNSSTLSYGAFRNRYKQVAVTSGATETTLYVAGLFEKVTLPSGTIEYRHYIPGGNGTAAIHTRRSTGIYDTFYWHADHLGSPELFTNSGGGVEVRPSFGAFGERRDGSDWLGPPSAGDLTTLAGITRRGFTGHEHLDSVGLIHMNGRVYDPGIGRFLGVDPIVGVGISQDANSYNYAHNSPLNITDPTGLCEIGIICNWRDGPGPEGPRIFEPAATICIGGNPDCHFVVSESWDGKSSLAGRAVTTYGVRAAQSVGAFVFPNVKALGERGVPGTALDNVVGGLKAAYNSLQGLAVLTNPTLAIQSALGQGPQPLEIADNELLGAAIGEGGTAVLGAFGVTRSIVARANSALAQRMNSIRVCSGTDCSEIAEKLYASAGRGQILRVTGQNGVDLKLLEYGRVESGFKYHEVYTDGRYIYDPRLSPSPVALRDWLRMIEDLNPGAVVK